MRIPESEWVWYGFGGHFVCRDQCAYHLCTRIGGYLISTIGYYIQHTGEAAYPLHGDPDSLYETYIFHCDGEDDEGNPNITEHSPIAQEFYADSLNAERGHRWHCNRCAELGGIDRRV